MIRTATVTLFILGAATVCAQSSPVQPQNATQPGAQQPSGASAWPADASTASPAPPAFAPNLGSSPNGEALSRAPRVVRVSGGVMEAQLVRRVQPVYGVIGQSGTGTVILAARVGRDGRVKGVSVISGPAELQKPTVDAVKQWIFKPYLLNGEPVAVDTTIALSSDR